jgi:hypothetical protein
MSRPEPLTLPKDLTPVQAVKALVGWFLENYERPEERTPRDDGDWVWIWGGPFISKNELDDEFYTELDAMFGEAMAERIIATATDIIEDVPEHDDSEESIVERLAGINPSEIYGSEYWTYAAHQDDYDDGDHDDGDHDKPDSQPPHPEAPKPAGESTPLSPTKGIQ